MAVHEVTLRHYIKDGTIELNITDLVNELTREDVLSHLRRPQRLYLLRVAYA